MPVTYFYTAIISFSLGIFMRTTGTFSMATLLWLGTLSLLLAVLDRRLVVKFGSYGFALVSLGLAFFIVGILRVDLALSAVGQSPLSSSLEQTVTLEGVVSKEPTVSGSSKQLLVAVGNDTVLVTTERTDDVTYGDQVEVTGKLVAPEAFTTDLGRAFNYPGYLLARDVEYRISFAQVKVTATGKGNGIVTQLLSFKHTLMTNIEEVLPEPAAGLAEGLLLGVHQALGDDLEDDFRESGIIHIVVLSGYNIMLVVTFVTYCLSFVLAPRPRLVVGLLAISAFALTVGLSATVMRASIMACILLVAQNFGRSYVVLRGLLAAGALMLLINPLLLVYDVGFQLSFVATLGLVLVAPYLEVWLVQAHRFVSLRSFLVATIATQIAVLPLLLYQIGQFSVVAVVVNLLVLPMVPAAMLLTFIAGMIGFVSLSLATVLSIPAYWSLIYIVKIAEWFANLPFASFIVPPFPFYVVPLTYGVLGFLLYRYRVVIADFANVPKADVSAKFSTLEIDSDWVIEEEFDEPLCQIKNNETQDAVPASGTASKPDPDLPIFFR